MSPQVPSGSGSDFYLVIGLTDAGQDVHGAAQTFVVQANSEEEAVGKLAALVKRTDIALYTAAVTPIFPPPS